MKTYEIRVTYDKVLNYVIRAENPEQAAKELDRRVTKTMRSGQGLENPCIRFTEIRGEEDNYSEGFEINGFTEVCEY